MDFKINIKTMENEIIDYLSHYFNFKSANMLFYFGDSFFFKIVPIETSVPINVVIKMGENIRISYSQSCFLSNSLDSCVDEYFGQFNNSISKIIKKDLIKIIDSIDAEPSDKSVNNDGFITGEIIFSRTDTIEKNCKLDLESKVLSILMAEKIDTPILKDDIDFLKSLNKKKAMFYFNSVISNTENKSLDFILDGIVFENGSITQESKDYVIITTQE